MELAAERGIMTHVYTQPGYFQGSGCKGHSAAVSWPNQYASSSCGTSPYADPARSAPVRPSKRSKNTMPRAIPAAAVPESSVTWITLEKGAPLVEQGLSDLAPALSYNTDLQELLSSAQSILYDLAGDAAGTVTLTHDTDWDVFPEVGAALKEKGREQECLCVAVCLGHSIWGVGTGSKWKQREQAARLALCVALAANVDSLCTVAKQYPKFIALCENSNIATGTLDDIDDCPTVVEGAPQTPPRRGGTTKRSHNAVHQDESHMPLAPKISRGQNGAMQHDRLPRDVPLWIHLPVAEAPDLLASLPPHALVVSTDGKTRRGLYSNADRAVSSLLGGSAAEAEYHDDANWDHFPTVGKVLKEIATAEECMTVAVCYSRDVWGVGVSMQGKNRFAAAKVALAASLALKAEEIGEEWDLSEFPAIAEFVDEARRARG